MYGFHQFIQPQFGLEQFVGNDKISPAQYFVEHQFSTEQFYIEQFLFRLHGIPPEPTPILYPIESLPDDDEDYRRQPRWATYNFNQEDEDFIHVIPLLIKLL